MGVQAMRDDKRGLGRERVSGRPADAEHAEEREEEARERTKDDLAGPPFPTVRGVAAASAAQESHDHSGR